MVPVFHSAHHDLLKGGANDGDFGHQVGGHGRGPIALLVPRKEVAGQGEGEGYAHHQDAEPEIQFAGSFVGSIDHHLHQVKNQKDDHRLSHIVMNAPEKPSARNLMLQKIDALPCSLSTWAVKHPKQSARYDLYEENESQATSPDIPPSGATGHFFVEGFLDQSPNARTIVQPIYEAFHERGIFSAMLGRNCWN